MNGLTQDRVVGAFLLGASSIIEAPGREAWDYGWSSREYRHSNRAAMSGPNGPVTIEQSAVAGWEEGVELLLREKRIQLRWDSTEFWSIAGSLTVAASDRSEEIRRDFLTRNLKRLREAAPAFTLQLLANVTWDTPPLVLGNAVLGNADDSLLQVARAAAEGRKVLDPEQATTWLVKDVAPRRRDGTGPVALGSWTVGQHQKSLSEAKRILRDVVDLPLLLEHDLHAFKVYRRGSVNRPGQRGLALDRGAVQHALQSSEASRELASFPVVVDEISPMYRPVHWHSADPLPLGEMLAQQYLHSAVCTTLNDDDPIARRIRVAARWFAEAHYSDAEDDAALALGVSMDALLTGKQALPGSAMADRFALLGAEPAERKERRRKYLECFSVRSSVAHGGKSSDLSKPGFLDGFFALVHGAAWRLLAMKEDFNPASESRIDDLFEGLRLGAVVWPTDAPIDR